MSAAADVVIGVDMGTTATKAVAYTPDGQQVAAAQHGYPLEEPEPGWAVQDPELILDAVLRAVADVVTEVGADRIAGLSFSSAMHSLMALDADLVPLTGVATWADTRATLQAERLRGSAPGLALHQRTGTPIHPMSPLMKLVWYREQDPETCRAAVFWVGIKDWVLQRMTGEFVTDHSLASCSGLLDIYRLDWDPEALQRAGITPEQLPRLVPTTTVLEGLAASVASATGLPASTRVVVGAGDGPLANLGVGAVRPGVAACSIGTSGALRVAVEAPAVDPQGGVFCYAITENRWVIGGAINNGGVVLNWVRDEIAAGRELSTPELLDAAASVPAGSGGLIMLPYLLSERAPHWSGLARGAYIGLTRAHTREHLVSAAVEGVAMQLALVLKSMRAAGLDIDEIRATGGVTKHSLWQQVLASVFNTRIDMLEEQEGSGLGAALLGMEALGLIESIDVAADITPVKHSVSPRPEDVETYQALLPIFDNLYTALLPTYTQLRSQAELLPMTREA